MLRGKKIYIIILAFLLVVILVLVGYQTYKNQSKAKKTVVQQQIVRRSKILGVIIRATTAKAIDVKTGKVITAARVFTLGDKTIYLALDLNSAKNGTSIDYIRYLNGRYIDHGNVKIAIDATNNITFNWTNVRPLGSVGDGKWKVATYTNGILEKRVSYLVQKNQALKVLPEDPVLASDSDYKLTKTLALVSTSH